MIKANISGKAKALNAGSRWRIAKLSMLFMPVVIAAFMLLAPEVVAQSVTVDLGEGGTLTGRVVQLILLMTVLSLAPGILVMMTSFTRIVIVLSFVRRSLAVNELPPNPILIGLALFLTSFVMGPVLKRVWDEAYVPYRAGDIAFQDAGDTAWQEMRGFLIANTREGEIEPE